MSEQTIATPPPAVFAAAPEAPQTTATPGAPTEDLSMLPPWARDSITRANEQAAAARIRAKELEQRPVLTPDQQAKLAQFEVLEQASKSDMQRLTESEEQAKRDAQEARDETTRYKVAATHQIPAEHFDLLGKGTEEEITARAVKVSELLKAQAAIAPVTPPTTRPLEQLRPGATPAEAQTTDDLVMAKLFGPGH